jgi:hypothetical protein
MPWILPVWTEGGSAAAMGETRRDTAREQGRRGAISGYGIPGAELASGEPFARRAGG